MQVPLQTTPSVQLEAGSAVQYGATNVRPQDDVVSDDIKRFGKAYQQLGQTINQLDDQLSDAEAKEHANNYATELNALQNEYTNLKGVNAVGMVEVNGEQVSVFKQYQEKAKELYADYKGKASSGNVEYIFGQKASAYTRSFIDDITKHSLKQSRDYLEEETTQEIINSQEAAKTHYKTWNDPNGEFNKKWIAGTIQIQELAKLKGWNTDPNAIDPTDPKKERKLGVSSQYIAEMNKYNKNVLEGVIKRLRQDNNHTGAKDFLRSLNPKGKSEDINELTKIVTAEQIEHGNSKCVDAIISNNGNQNDGNVLSQMGAMLCLSSNQAHDNNNGGSVVDTLNSNEVDITERKQSENIDTLDKMRSTSKFYQPDSGVKLIPQHQTTHLFAIAKLGVKQADSLYTKAKSSIEIDQERFNTDPEYATEINGKIIDNYNELILEASEAKYGNKSTVKLKQQIEEARNEKGTGRSFQKRKTEKINKLLAELKKAEEADPKYVNKIANDLDIITSGIDYNYGSEESTIEVNEVTGLQPLAVLKAKLKATITDPKELKTALKDLEFKYNKIKTEREAAYKGALEEAQEIAFNPEGNGWKDLAANNIDINDFTEADQEILRNGPPEESDIETVANLDANPAEVRDNLNVHRPKLSTTEYLQLKQYAQNLKTNESKYIEATGDNTLFKDTLYKNGYTWVYDTLKGNNAVKFHSMKTAWINRIDYVQTHVEKRKLTREEKLRLLNNVLIDDVYTGLGLKETPMSFISIKPDQLRKTWVHVPVKQANGKFKKERIYGSDIDPFVQSAIKAYLFRNKKAMTQQRIAEIWVKFGRAESEGEFKKNVKAATLSLSTR